MIVMLDMSCLNCNITNKAGPELVGWQPEPSGRGTLSLILSCLTTIAFCTWVIIHPRIDNRRGHRFAHKLSLFIRALLAPELIAVEAAQEYTQARKVLSDCGELTNYECRLIHVFYIGMFGIRQRTPDGDRVLWPNQFDWLLRNKLIDWEKVESWGVTQELIEDKSKADAIAKLIALAQTAWFVVQSVMRAIHHLPLSPLESMTLGYIPLFGVTYLYWWVKPKDIETPTLITLDITTEQRATLDSLALSETFDHEDSPAQASYWQIWHLTPRIFEKVERDLLPKRSSPSPTSKPIVLSHWHPDLYQSPIWPLACLLGLSFGALHLACWNTLFPTLVEAWLWRASAITSMLTLLIFMQWKKVVLTWRDPLIGLKVACPALYVGSRVVMLAGAVAAFRGMEGAIYRT